MTLNIRQACGQSARRGPLRRRTQPGSNAHGSSSSVRLASFSFRRNIADVTQTRALLGRINNLLRRAASLRCVDIEGGTVDRLRDAVARMPSAQTVAQTGKLALMRRHGALIAKEAAVFGLIARLRRFWTWLCLPPPRSWGRAPLLPILQALSLMPGHFWPAS